MSDSTTPGVNERYEEFVQLLTRHQAGLFSYIYALLASWTDAEDVLQQTSVVLWQKFDQFERGTDFGRWACTIARYKTLKRLRERARDRHVFNDALLELLAEEGLDDLERQEAERRALGTCLEKLPTSDREVLRGYYSRQVSVAELASTQGRTIAAVYKLLSRIRAALLSCIERRLAAEGYS